MIRRSLEMLSTPAGESGSLRLRSPAVGIYQGGPRPGEGLVAGSLGGTLVVLGRTMDLLVPRGVSGVVTHVLALRGGVPVAYGDTLMEIAPAANAVQRAAAEDSRGALRRGSGPTAGWGANESLGPDLFALRAPTTGVFYGRPDPSSSPFVSVGSTLSEGQTAGLIEVMKTFSPLVHPGGELPSPALVAEVRVEEGAEVGRGQVLFVLRAV